MQLGRMTLDAEIYARIVQIANRDDMHPHAVIKRSLKENPLAPERASA